MSPAETVRAVTTGVSRLIAGNLTEDQKQAQLDALAGLYAEHTDVRHPLAPLGDTPLRTRAELRRHFAGGPGAARKTDPTEPGAARKADPSEPSAAKRADPAEPGAAKRADPAEPGAAKRADPAEPSAAIKAEADPAGPGAVTSAGVDRFEAVGEIFETADPEVVVHEFRYVGSVDGRPFSVPCIFVTRVRDGLIVESRDYLDHVGMARAFNRLGALTTALAATAQP